MSQFEIDRVYEAAIAVFCREPNAIYHFPVPLDDIDHPLLKRIVQAAQELVDVGHAPTIEALAAKGCGSIDELEAWDARVTERIRADWNLYPRLIRLAAQKRRLLAWHHEQLEQLVKTPLLDLPDHLSQSETAFAQLATDVSDEESTEVGSLIEAVQAGKGQAAIMTADPIATGVPPVDDAMGGGLRKNEILVVGGGFKGGKTTGLRQIGDTVPSQGAGFLQVAADGGNRYRQACMYLSRRAAFYAVQADIPTLVHGYRKDALDETNIAIWLWNIGHPDDQRELVTPIPPQIEECLVAGRDDMIRLRQTGRLVIVDVKHVGFDIENAARYIRQAVFNQGIDVVGIDHVGKFGDTGKRDIFDRYSHNARVLIQLAHSLPISMVVLSQRNAQGVALSSKDTGDDDEDKHYSAQLEGGKMWEQEADLIALVSRPSGDVLRWKNKLFRRGESHEGRVELKLHPASGLFIDGLLRYQAVEGY